MQKNIFFLFVFLLNYSINATTTPPLTLTSGQLPTTMHQIIPANVLARVELLGNELELIRRALGKPKERQSILSVKNASPKEVYFEALALFEKSNRLAFEVTSSYQQEPLLTSDDISPTEIWFLINAALKRILIVKEKLQIKKNKKDNLVANMLNSKARPIAEKSNFLIDSIIKTLKSSQKKEVEKTKIITDNLVNVIISSIIFLLLYAIWAAKKNALKILGPISTLAMATKKFSSGNLEHRFVVTGNNDIANLAESFNQMLYVINIAEKKIVQIIETSSGPVIKIDNKGIIKFTNSATTKFLGYTKKELIGNNIAIIIPEPHESKHDIYIKKYIKTKNKKAIGKSRELIAIKKNGVHSPIRLSVNQIIVNHEMFFVGIIHDIAKEKEQEKRIFYINQKLEMDMQEKSIIADLEDTLRGIDDLSIFSKQTLIFFQRNSLFHYPCFT